jgi:hypothetical protein
MPETDWVQLDGFRTREEHRITPQFTDLAVHHHTSTGVDPHDGPIDPADFEVSAYLPALDYPQQLVLLADRNNRRLSYVYLREWLATPNPDDLLPLVDHYDSAAQFWGSVSGVHDWNPLAWEAETRLALLAAFDADNPGVTFRYLEWETNPFQLEPFGTYTNRMIEVALDANVVTDYDREGDPVSAGSEEPVGHGLVALGRDGVPLADSYGWSYDATNEWYVIDGTPGGVDSLSDAGTLGEVLTEFNDTIQVDISDSWWEDNAYLGDGLAEDVPATFRSTFSLPLMLGPATAINNEVALPIGGEFEKSWRETARLYFEHDWTPPRYRIVYTDTPVTPVLRHFPRDGDGRGWGGVTRGYPPPRGRRGYGGARQP